MPSAPSLVSKISPAWVLGFASIVAIAGGWYYSAQQSRVKVLRVAAGSTSSDSYIICAALKAVVERHHKDINLEILKTGGTSENLRLLDAKQVQLATAQADVPASDDARIIAVLFQDTFQLAVRQSSGITSIAGLKGRRIGTPRTGGQYRSFLTVASHFGLAETDFEFVGANDEEADRAFLAGEADAIFRVRTLSNDAILQLVKHGNLAFLPIDQAEAMQITIPAFRASQIPRGAYKGNPPIPKENIPAIAVDRTFLTHRAVDAELVQAVTAALVENRHEVALAIPEHLAHVRPLLAGIRQPETTSGLGVALHPGAKAFYERDEPSFFQKYADYVGLWITGILVLGSWLWEGRKYFDKQRRQLVEVHNQEIFKLIDRTHRATSVETLDEIADSLLDKLMDAVRELGHGKMTIEAFHSFQQVWQVGVEAVRERRVKLAPPGGAPAIAP